MTIQAFNIYTARGYAGDLVDSGPNVSQTGICEDATLAIGVACERGTAARDITVSAAANVFGIVRRELALEAKNKPSDGTTEFKQNESVSVLRQGYVYVELASAVAAGALLAVSATGTFGGTEATPTSNVTAEQTGIAGDIVRARIDIVA